MEKQIEKFISVMSPDVPMVYRAISKCWKSTTIWESNAISNKEDNIYFLWWVNKNATRMTDHDLDTIHYIRLDIDIKKWIMESLWVEADRGDIEWFTKEIIDALKKNEFLKDFSYVILSWWGCHIYYSNKVWVDINKEVTPKVWQLAMKRIYKLFDETIINNCWEDYSYINADKAVCNTARIMRMPGTINQKKWEPCVIFYEDPDCQSLLLWHVKALWLKSLKENQELSEKRTLEIEDMRQQLIAQGWWDTDLKYQIINKFPSYIIVQLLLPEFPFDWRKNFKDSWKLKGYYYVAKTNSICNWGSHEFNWWTTESCWNNFSLVGRHLGLSKEETFRFFEDNFNI